MENMGTWKKQSRRHPRKCQYIYTPSPLSNLGAELKEEMRNINQDFKRVCKKSLKNYRNKNL